MLHCATSRRARTRECALFALARSARSKPAAGRLAAARSGADEWRTMRRSMRRGARSIRSASHGTFRRIKWAVLFVTLGIYYFLPFLRWDRGPNAPGQAVLIDLSEPALLLLLHRDLAAGNLLPHRPADHRGDGAVPDERARRPHLVRLSLPADGVDRSVPADRALVRRRPRASTCGATRAVDRRADRAARR